MKAEAFAELLGAEFYTGVPDSQLHLSKFTSLL